MPFELTCKHCGKQFVHPKSTPIYCSKSCSNRARAIPPEDRFWKFVTKTADCWLWIGGRSGDGYGAFTLRPHQMVSAHRFAYELQCGPIADGLHVLHRCDNPLCVRGDHLFLGTNALNSADKVAKRRHRYGDSHPRAVLDEGSVRAIRARYARGGVTQTALAAEYGVDQTIISDVVRRKTWRHVMD